MCRYNARTRSRCRMRRMVEEQWQNYYMTNNSMTLAGLKWLRGQNETPSVTVDFRDAGCRKNSHHDTNLKNQKRKYQSQKHIETIMKLHNMMIRYECKFRPTILLTKKNKKEW
jgi:hypothetical protein